MGGLCRWSALLGHPVGDGSLAAWSGAITAYRASTADERTARLVPAHAAEAVARLDIGAVGWERGGLVGLARTDLVVAAAVVVTAAEHGRRCCEAACAEVGDASVRPSHAPLLSTHEVAIQWPYGCKNASEVFGRGYVTGRFAVDVFITAQAALGRTVHTRLCDARLCPALRARAAGLPLWPLLQHGSGVPSGASRSSAQLSLCVSLVAGADGRGGVRGHSTRAGVLTQAAVEDCVELGTEGKGCPIRARQIAGWGQEAARSEAPLFAYGRELIAQLQILAAKYPGPSAAAREARRDRALALLDVAVPRGAGFDSASAPRGAAGLRAFAASGRWASSSHPCSGVLCADAALPPFAVPFVVTDRLLRAQSIHRELRRRLGVALPGARGEFAAEALRAAEAATPVLFGRLRRARLEEAAALEEALALAPASAAEAAGCEPEGRLELELRRHVDWDRLRRSRLPRHAGLTPAVVAALSDVALRELLGDDEVSYACPLSSGA